MSVEGRREALRAALLIGQAPARSAKVGTRAWDSASGRRLAKMMGIEVETLLATFDTTNLNNALHGTRGRWDEFDVEEARCMAAYLRRSILWQYDVVLLCGMRVAECFGMRAPSHERVRMAKVEGGTRVVLFYAIPHPGGTNLWWNEPGNRARGVEVAARAWEAARRARRRAVLAR